MGKGLLAQWRRGMVARGLVGAVLFAVPVAIAAAIGFGTSLSGVAGGLSAIANGPDAITISTETTPTKLNRSVARLASRDAPGGSTLTRGRDETSGGGSDINGISDGGSSGGGAPSSGGGSSGGGGGDGGAAAPTIEPPVLELPGAGGGGDGVTGGSVGSTVNGVVDGVDNTVNGLLGG